MSKGKKWMEVKCDYICEDPNDMFWRVDAWKTADDWEEGKVIAYIDDLTGRVVYADPDAQWDEYAQAVIKEKQAELRARGFAFSNVYAYRERLATGETMERSFLDEAMGKEFLRDRVESVMGMTMERLAVFAEGKDKITDTYVSYDDGKGFYLFALDKKPILEEES